MSDGTLDPMAAGQRQAAEHTDVAALRQRLAFYEGFDRIIQENVTRSGDLLRLAAERQAEADSAVVAARRVLATQTRRQHAVLAQLLSDVAGLRSSLDSIEDRLRSSLEAFAAGEGQLANEPLDPLALDPIDAANSSDDPASSPVRAASAVPSRNDGSGDRASQSLLRPAADEIGPSSQADMSEPTQVERGSPTTARTVIVHGVPDVSRARALVEHLRGREGIARVDPREFAGGVLRLAVDGPRRVTADDISAWNWGGVVVTDEAVETLVLRLPEASSL